MAPRARAHRPAERRVERVDDAGHGGDGGQHQADGQPQDGADVGPELPGGGLERGVVDEGWQEHQQEELGRQLDLVVYRDEGHGDAHDDQQDRVGDPDPVGDGGHGHHADEQADAVGQIGHQRRPPGRVAGESPVGRAVTVDNLPSTAPRPSDRSAGPERPTGGPGSVSAGVRRARRAVPPGGPRDPPGEDGHGDTAATHREGGLRHRRRPGPGPGARRPAGRRGRRPDHLRPLRRALDDQLSRVGRGRPGRDGRADREGGPAGGRPAGRHEGRGGVAVAGGRRGRRARAPRRGGGQRRDRQCQPLLGDQ